MALVGHISGSTQSNSVIGISGSVIVANRPSELFPLIAGTDVTFFVSGSRDGTGRTVFGGDLTSSGSLTVKDTTGTSKFSVASSTGNTVVGGTLGSSGDFSVGTSKFSVTAASGNTSAQGTLNVISSITGSSSLTVGSDIVTTATTQNLINTTATTINFGGAANTINLGTSTTAQKYVYLGTGATTNTTNVYVGSQAGANNSILIGGGAGTNSITIGGATGTTTMASNVTANKNVTITGDLTVNGTMVTVNTTNLEVKDSIIGLGFASGTIQQSAGDRGWIGGIASANNVMNKWDTNANEFVFARTTASATGSSGLYPIASYADFHANNIQGYIVSASFGLSGSLTKLIDGTSYMIAGSGVSISSASNGAVTISTTGGGGDVTGPGSSLDNQIVVFDSTTGKVIKAPGNAFVDASGNITGSSLVLNTNEISGSGGGNVLLGSLGNVAVLGDLEVRGGDLTTNQTTFNLVNTTATTVNIGGAATTVEVGSTTGTTSINHDLSVDGNTTLGNATTDTITFTARANSDLLPTTDSTYNLGSADKRWANVYTGDLHLRNDRGNWTLIEEENYLTIRNNNTGKIFRLLMEEVITK